MTAFHEPVFQAYVLAASAAIILMYALGFLTAKTRADRKIVLNREDAKINGGATVAEVEHADVARLKRAHQNAIEATVPFLAIGFLYAMTAPGVTMARALFAVFVIARLLHAIFYVGAKQPFRTIAFGIGTLANVIMVVQVVRAALG